MLNRAGSLTNIDYLKKMGIGTTFCYSGFHEIALFTVVGGSNSKNFRASAAHWYLYNPFSPPIKCPFLPILTITSHL